MAKPRYEKIFIWEGMNTQGIKVSGEMQTYNRQLVQAKLRQKGIKIIRIRKKPSPLFNPKIRSQHITQFTQQLVTMIQSGIPIIQSLELIATTQDNHQNLQNLTLKIKQDVTCGTTLANALKKYPKYFDDLFIGLVKAGEYAGKLDVMLNKIADYREKNEKLKTKIKKALLYPSLVLITTMVVLSIMLIWVVPQFKAVFNNFGADLPPFTRFVINLSEWLQQNIWLVIILIVGIQQLFVYARKYSLTVYRWTTQLSFKIPIIGKLLYQAIIARFARTLSILFSADISLVDSMDAIAKSIINKIYIEAVLSIKEDINKGIQLHTALQKTNVFPNMLIQMIKIGEEAGQLEQMLTKAAEHYENQVDHLQDVLSRQFEPLIIIFLGILVGGLIISLYLPIFTIGNVI